MKLRWNPPEIKNRTARLHSRAPHSADVVFGKARDDGTEMPARDFFSAAIAEFNFEEMFLYNFDEGSDQAFEAMTEALHELIKFMIQDPRWQWDRVTIRSTGEIASSPRNITDTKELLNSQEVEYLD